MFAKWWTYDDEIQYRRYYRALAVHEMLNFDNEIFTMMFTATEKIFSKKSFVHQKILKG